MSVATHDENVGAERRCLPQQLVAGIATERVGLDSLALHAMP